MRKWRRVWRTGLAPQFSVAGLRALHMALICDDPRLMQGATCFPLPSAECAVSGACAIGFCGRS